MPTLADMKNVYDVLTETEPEEEGAKDAHNKRLELLVWCLDEHLPAAVGEAYFGKDKRHCMKMTSKTPLTVHGEQRILVTKQSEAFGLLLFANHEKRWGLIAEKRKENGPRWKIPKYDAHNSETHPYHETVFSNPMSGQGHGWSKEARKAFNDDCTAIEARRKDHPEIFQKALEVLREAVGITEDEPLAKGKKRKRSNTKATKKQDEEEDDFVELDDESEGDYSVHSEAEP